MKTLETIFNLIKDHEGVSAVIFTAFILMCCFLYAAFSNEKDEFKQ